MTSPSGTARVRIVEAHAETLPASFAEEVEKGLTAPQKSLPCRFLYDAEGSRLFEQICTLPEYYLTRAEEEILDRHATQIVEQLPGETTLVELGSGSSTKTRHLIEALLDVQEDLHFVPIDISPAILDHSARELTSRYPRLVIRGVAGEYRDGLRRLDDAPAERRLILWLGSSIGNFDRDAAASFLHEVRETAETQDLLLVGVDMRKDRAVLERAYDDAQGVTARFNKNLLARINRELGGHFELDAFRHSAVYEEEAGRVVIGLVSEKTQTVSIDTLELEVAFETGEFIHTEDSHKYSLREIDETARGARFRVLARWFDGERRFTLNLLQPI